MTYLRVNRRPGDKRNRTIFSVIGFVVLIIAVFQFSYPHFIPSVFTSFVKPFWTARFTAKIGGLDSRESLLLQNEELNRKISEYEVRLGTIREIEQENAQLKTILGRPDNKSPKTPTTTTDKVYKKNLNSTSTTQDIAIINASSSVDMTFLRKNIDGRILSAVLVRPPFSGYDEYIIDIGTDFGVKVGSKVYAPGDVLIGHVADVLSNTSKVILYSSPGEKYEVTVGALNNFATAVGRGGGQYEVSLPRDAKVADGDFVNAPSVSDKPLGVVTAVISDPAQPFETVLFTSTINIYNIRWVLVSVK